jgi:hypothetical protein
MLDSACPEGKRGELASRSLREQNQLLLQLREMTFGPRLDGYAECPKCSLRLELSLAIESLRERLATAASGGPVEITHGSFRLKLREAGAAELVAAAALADLTEARRFLACHCIEAADGDGKPIAAGELPEETFSAALERLDALHEGAALVLEFCCPDCQTRHELQLDLAHFLWTEVRLSASRTLDEVHELAWAYGWSEEAILAMTPQRRHAYLERVRQ